MRKRIYFGVIERGSDGYGIYFPDLPGCVSGGDTIEQLIASGTEVLQFHIDSMVEDGDPIPLPTEPDLAAERIDVPEANLIGLVPIEVNLPVFPSTADVAIDLPLLQELDRLNVNRRAFITEATRRELERLKKSA